MLKIAQKIKRLLPALLWLVIITIISGFPGDQIPKQPIWQFDKFVHTFIYLIFSFCLMFAFEKQYSKAHNRFMILSVIVFFGIFYGGFMEICQHYIFINRSGNWYDFIANALGSILGVLLYPFIIKLLPLK